MGTIFIRALPVSCVVGVRPEERASRQRLLISIELELDFTAAAANDRLETALDYAEVAERVTQLAETGRFRLLETLAERAAAELLRTPVTRVTVEIEKPAALAATRQVGVRVTREQTEDGGWPDAPC